MTCISGSPPRVRGKECRVTPMTEQYHTKEGTTITRQTEQVEFTAIKRTSDGHWKYTADEGQNGFDATTTSFLSTIYTPTFTSVSQGGGGFGQSDS